MIAGQPNTQPEKFNPKKTIFAKIICQLNWLPIDKCTKCTIGLANTSSPAQKTITFHSNGNFSKDRSEKVLVYEPSLIPSLIANILQTLLLQDLVLLKEDFLSNTKPQERQSLIFSCFGGAQLSQNLFMTFSFTTPYFESNLFLISQDTVTIV